MKFEIILNLLESETQPPYDSLLDSLGSKPIFVFDRKGRKLTELSFYDGYSITEESRENLRIFCEKCKKDEITYFVVRLEENIIFLYDQNKKFLLSLHRKS